MNAKDISDEEIYANFDKALTWAEKYTKGNLIPQIMGGEPTIHSNFMTLVKELKKLPVEINAFTNFSNTNE